ncbi:hypothetical protein IPZ60_13955 [Psychrobacter sp. NG25]|uniref:hypothetical protein n=1 Tax=Psychrobacter sp. NG25 TaxID=2782005 RepID=UPI0018840ED5|nr:hypothetical protein [Psychrobacter sp. NG25]MBF0659846.1 hypothetical protein [Psychrobacter sp. NG25]
MKYLNRSAITVYGTEKLLNWIKENHPSLCNWDLDALNHHPNIYLVDDEDQNCWGDCFEENFDTIFRCEVGEFTHGRIKAPVNVTFESHSSWFTFEYTELVHDLSVSTIKLYDE